MFVRRNLLKRERRRSILKDFLLNILHVGPETAEATACRLEHAIDPESLEKLVGFVNFINTCPKTRSDWLEHFHEHLRSEEPDWEKCEQCLVKCEREHQAEK